MASSSSTPSSSITPKKKYQVFLSFRGEDTRVGFTSHLDAALNRTCMLTFIDNKLVRGDEISTALLKSIPESMIAVVIFSKDYASSKWCLRELAEIMKREKLHELIVLPVFYNVDPSDVRKQTGPFKDSFAKHETESPEEVLEWRKAFTDASNLSGWDSAVTRPESKLVRDIVKDVQYKLMSEIENISPPLNDLGLIGIENRIEPVMSLLCLGRRDVQIIGIWGMGGIGKTTLTEVVFNQISDQFDGSCFIEKVGERLENGKTNDLQHEVLSKVLHEENLQLATPTILSPFIQQRLSQRKVLIVFDDVNNFLRLDGFVKGLQFGFGSRIIITSRDKQVLYNFEVPDSNIYEVPRLNFFEALMLFSNYAFKQNRPTEDFMALSERMVYYANGNPLALRVLGSALLGMSKEEWESAVDDLQGIDDSDIFNVFKLSYDRLSDKEKNLFLDIACFFYGDGEDYITELLDCKYSLRVLINKSLITIEQEPDKMPTIEMHDLLQEMGWKIVRRESPNNPGKRSRLWKHDDVVRTLKNNNGTGAVEGIDLNMDSLKDDLILGSQIFDKMHNLRLLSFTRYFKTSIVLLPNGLNSLPDDLIILLWHRYPLRALPSNFSPEKLVKLNLSSSNIEQLWKGTKIFQDAIVTQPSKMIRQTKVWISWSGGIDSKSKGEERRKQRLGLVGMVETVRMVKFRGSFQRANELKIDIIICFRKSQDEPYKCYEDSVFYNGPQHIRIRPSRLLREDLSWTRAGHCELDEMIRADFRGPLQRAYEVGSSIIICFRKAQDEPYKCYEDSVFYNGPQHIRIRPLSFRRAKTAISSFMVFNCCHDSVRLFYFLLVYM